MRRLLPAFLTVMVMMLLFSSFRDEQNCALLTHNSFTDFNASPKPPTPTSLWLNIHTKLDNTDLVNNGDFLLFTGGTITLNGISSTPAVANVSIPDGKIIADNTVTKPVTSYDMGTNTWTTKVPPGYSTSDIFISGAIITSSTGFSITGSKSSTIKGFFFSNRPSFKQSWFYGLAAYQPPFSYSDISSAGQVTSVGGGIKAGTPVPEEQFLVAGGSGGGGSNFTGSYSSTDNFMTCLKTSCNLSASTQVTNVTCNGGSNGSIIVTLTGGTPPFAYSNSGGIFFTTSNPVATFNNMPAGTYPFTVTDGSGCTTNSSVTVSQPPALQVSGITVNATNNLSNGSITLTVTGGTPPYSFLWNTGANTENLSGLGAGTYTVTVMDANGCTATLTEVLSGQVCTSLSVTANVIRGDFENSCDGEATINVSGGTPPYTYQWSDGVTTNVNTRNNLCGPPAGSGTPVQYGVVVTDANGCTGNASFEIDVTSVAPSSIMGTMQTMNGTQTDPPGNLHNTFVYPNPSHGVVHIQFNSQETVNAEIKMIDLSGRLIKVTNVNLDKGPSTKDFQLPSHASGFYMLQIKTGKEIRVLPIRVN